MTKPALPWRRLIALGVGLSAMLAYAAWQCLEPHGAFEFAYAPFTPTPLPYQYQLVAQREMPNLSPNNPKFATVIWTWQRMPNTITRWLGPKLSRYFP